MFQQLGDFLLRNPFQAGLVVFLFAGASIFFPSVPLLNWVSMVVLALVTLRIGPQTGALLLLGVVLSILVLLFLTGKSYLFLYGLLDCLLLVWGLAYLLRAYASWVPVLRGFFFISTAVICGLHISNPDISLVWLSLMKEAMVHIETMFVPQFDLAEWEENIQFVAKMGTGIFGVVLGLKAMIQLLVARWWQSVLFNPDGLKKEIYAIRLKKIDFGLLLLVVLLLAMEGSWAWNLLPPVVLVFGLAGLSLAHSLFSGLTYARIWLLLLYTSMIFLFPYVVLTLVLLAIIDIFWDMRVISR